MDTRDSFNTLCDVLALIYHEARNVRHLVRGNLRETEKWRFVVSLPTNRGEAWRQIYPLRDKAKQASSVDAALRIFERRFHVSLRDLEEMFGNKNWRHARMYGANAWKAIVSLTLELVNALRNADPAAADSIVNQIKSARHNTGSLYEKLSRLERAQSEDRNPSSRDGQLSSWMRYMDVGLEEAGETRRYDAKEHKIRRFTCLLRPSY